MTALLKKGSLQGTSADNMLSRYLVGGDALRETPAMGPLASINYGAAGVAYAMYRMALRRGDYELLAAADVWTQRSYTLSELPQAFYDPAFDIRPETVGASSLFHSRLGLHCVRSLVSAAMGDVSGTDQAVSAFIEGVPPDSEYFDFCLGDAGILSGCAELLEAIPADQFRNRATIAASAEVIAFRLIELLRSDSIATSLRVPSLGIAHGWGGILLALLRWSRATGSKPDLAVVDELLELGGLAEPHGGGLRWPAYNTSAVPTFDDSWCNGTAGHVMLYALACEVLNEGNFAELSIRGAESSWMTTSEVATLCCGGAGVAYGLLAAYRLTGNRMWLDRAQRLCTSAVNTPVSKYFLKDALYKGSVGVALLSQEILDPSCAAMPLCECAAI